MGLIAETCPRCKRVTVCAVSGGNGFVGGYLFGIPFYLPTSTVQCVCASCGHSFRSRLSVEERAIPAELAAGLDLDALLGLTNPELQQARILSDLRPDPRLSDAFALLDRLSRGPLRSGLESELARWPTIEEPDRADFLGRVEACSGAEQFARAMAARRPFEATGCLLSLVVVAVVWSTAWFTLSRPGTLVWALVGIVGLAAAGVPYQLVSASRGRQWVRDVLVPEANQAGVPLAWVLAVLEKTVATRGTTDEVGSLRDLAPAIREELAAVDAIPEDHRIGFGVSK